MLATLSLALTLLLDGINVCTTTLCGFYFQSVDPQWFKPIREWVLKSVQKRVLLALLIYLFIYQSSLSFNYVLDISSLLPIFIRNLFSYRKFQDHRILGLN